MGCFKLTGKIIFNKIIFSSAIIFASIFTACKKHPERIVSLSPCATEILCAVGAFSQIAARSADSDYPSEVLSIPSLGSDSENLPDTEELISFKPDFVYLSSGTCERLIPFLKSQKIRFFISTNHSVDGIFSEMREIGKITGHKEEAEQKAKEIEEKINEIAKKSDSNEKSIYWEICAFPFVSVGKNSVISQLIKIAGGKNIFDELSEAYPIVDEKSIFEKNPDIIIISGMSAQSMKSIEQIKIRDGWENLSAIKNGRIFVLNSNYMVQPSLRITDKAELIADCLKD